MMNASSLLESSSISLSALETIPFQPPPRPEDPPAETIRDASTVRLEFNVMPEKEISETLHVREYRVWDNYAEATFDRTYSSMMTASPSHLIFLTGLAHSQKLLYVLMAHRLGRRYSPGDPEFGKFWVTDLRIHIPRMVRQEVNLVERLWILSQVRTGESSWSIEVYTSFCDSLGMWGRIPFFLL